MKYTKEQQELIDTKFSPELEKEAAEEAGKVQELYSTGFSKFASETADLMDKVAKEEEESEEDEDEKKEQEKKAALSDEHKKEATARAAFIARGYIDGLMKEGSERHNDELHYLYPAIYEKLAGSKMESAKAALKASPAKLKEMYSKSKASVSAAASKAKASASAAGSKAKEHVKSNKAAYAGGAAGLAGFGLGRASKSNKE